MKIQKNYILNNMINNINNIGYEKALQEVINVRIERRAKYGDSWKDRKEYQLMGLVKEKADRLEYNFLNSNNSYENKKDCLVDLINWALFYLQVELDKKNNIRKI